MITKGLCFVQLNISTGLVVSFYVLSGLHPIALLLNPNLKADELKYCLADNEISLIIIDLTRATLCLRAMLELGKRIRLIVIDDQDEPLSYPLATSNDLSSPSASYEGALIYLYSSGSNGKAKKVCRTQKDLFYETEAYTSPVHMTATDSVLCSVPSFHPYGFVAYMLATISNGTIMALLEQAVGDGGPVEVSFVFRMQRVFEFIQQEQISLLPASPYIFSVLEETPDGVHLDLSSLRLCLTSGNVLPEETFVRFKQGFGIPPRPAYGSTETGIGALNLEPDAQVQHNSVGEPFTDDIEVKIIDGTTLAELPPCIVGEIAVKSQAMTSSYLDMPELNREVFKEGFFFTGDLGKKDEEGRLYITGRKKIFIDSGGEKVDPFCYGGYEKPALLEKLPNGKPLHFHTHLNLPCSLSVGIGNWCGRSTYQDNTRCRSNRAALLFVA